MLREEKIIIAEIWAERLKGNYNANFRFSKAEMALLFSNFIPFMNSKNIRNSQF